MIRISALTRIVTFASPLMVLGSCATTDGPASFAAGDPATGIAAEAPGPQFPVMMKVGGCKMVRRNGHILLSAPTNDRSLIQTREEYRPPFVVRLRAKIDTASIRLYYNAGMVILNWKVHPSQLRFHDPVNDKMSAFNDKGTIELNTFHDIAWEIYPDGTRLVLNDKEVMTKLGDYGDLVAPIGVGPAFGSVIMLESFSVHELQGTLEGTQGASHGIHQTCIARW